MNLLVEISQAQAGDQSIREQESLRDNCLARITVALSEYEMGAGKVLAKHQLERK